jgi:hypothetical protein
VAGWELKIPQRITALCTSLAEDFAIEQFIAQATSLTPIWRIASAIF